MALGSLAAQAKPNFSGTWKMDPAKCDFGRGVVSLSRLDRIVHEDPNLKDTITQKTKDGESTYDMIYTTDGKENTNHPNGKEFTAHARWEGDVLVIDSEGTLARQVSLTDRYTLSADGKTLTIHRHAKNWLGSTDQTIIFDKQ